MDAIKKIFKDDKKDSHKEEFHSETHTKTTAVQPQIATTRVRTEQRCEFSADKLEEEAARLKEQACKKMQAADTTFMAAQAAQQEVERAAARANIVTNAALRQEIEGQKNLVMAGQKLMEAGAKLQEEAAGQTHQAEISMIQKGTINQSIGVEVPKIPASEMHIIQNRVGAECRPVVETEVHSERIDIQNRPIV